MQTVQVFKPINALVIAFIAFYSSFAVSADSPPNLVTLFGDSISYGYNQAFPSVEEGAGRINRGYPSIYLDAILTANNRVSLVSNLGVGGSASGPSTDPGLYSNNGVNRINSDLAYINSLHAPSKARYALIMYGTNDHAYSISNTTTRFNIRFLIEEANDEGFIPVVGTIPPCECKDVGPLNYRIAQAVALEQTDGEEVYLVDHYSNLVSLGWSALVDPDGVHPNNSGYLAIAQFWYSNRLDALIEKDKELSLAGILMLLLDDDQ